MTDEQHNAAWLSALSLRERIASLREAPDAEDGPIDEGDEGDEERARRELALWRSQAPFPAPGWFERRLAADGISEAELARLLGEPLEALRARQPSAPGWLVAIQRAFEDVPRGAPSELPYPESVRALPTAGFLQALEPLVRAGLARLRAGLETLDAPPGLLVREELERIFLNDLPWRLHTLVMRAFVLELNIARLQGTLSGATPAERFASFTARLSDSSAALDLLAQYPVLARQAQEMIERWFGYALEFLGHLCADWPELRRRFFPRADPGALAGVEGGAGDVHRGGRSVLLLRFASGARLVYKPRSLAVDVHFQELVRWLNERGDRSQLAALATLEVLDRGSWGWVEFVPQAPVASEDGARRFYQRLGEYLALFHALEATDLHFENLIAAGEHPVPIDLESLFHARFPLVPSDQPDVRLVTAASAESVLRVGLLPQRAWAREERPGLDISGLSSVEGQATPDPVLQWERLGTDEMHARREFLAMPGGKNQPRLAESELSVLDYARDFCAGFARMYRLLAEHRDELLAPGGPIERFAQDEVRSVLRPTRTYGLFQLESQHPDLQRDALELERFLDRLWVGAEENERLARTVAHERADLLAGDIPFFTCRAGSTELVTSSGEHLPGFWDESGLELVRRRLSGFDERDLERQLWFVNASFATMTLAKEETYHWPSYAPVAGVVVPEAQALRARLIAEAVRIGERFERIALRDDSDVAWVGLVLAKGQWDLAALLEDMYAGLSGVMHFLAYLGQVSGQERFGELAHNAWRTLRRRLEFVRGSMRAIGAFSGWGSVLYGISHWSRLWDDASLQQEARTITGLLPELLATDTDLDVVGGAAGCLLALLSWHAVEPADEVLELATRCGEHLLSHARSMPEGIAWPTSLESERPITGFSHGASGIAFALARLARASGERRFLAAAHDAIRYERSQYDAAQGNWYDPPDRSGATGPGTLARSALSMAWCYGAPGIGLARLALCAELDDPRIEEEAAAALAVTLERGFGRNHSLCHGDLGNLDFLLQARRIFPGRELDSAIARLAAQALASMQRDGWICGVPLGVESPSLMNGLAGIGYGLLRLAEPARVPSVLTLDPPLPLTP